MMKAGAQEVCNVCKSASQTWSARIPASVLSKSLYGKCKPVMPSEGRLRAAGVRLAKGALSAPEPFEIGESFRTSSNRC